MLYIFSPAEKLQAVLREYFDALHMEKLDGENTFAFSVPAGRADSLHVTEGNLAAFCDLDGAWQLFEIKQVTDLHGESLLRRAFCEHAYYELIDDFIRDVALETVSAHSALSQVLFGTRWSVGYTADLGQNSTRCYYLSALSALRQIAAVWGGELRFRLTVTDGAITARHVDLLSRRGTDSGKQFAYAKDIRSIEREVDLSGTVTALIGRGSGAALSGGVSTRLSFADIVWTSPPHPVNKPAGQDWVGDPEALVRWGRPGGRHRFGVFEDEEADAAILLAKTWNALKERRDPRLTYRLDVLDLERVSGYRHEKVRLGDTVRVVDRAFAPELLVAARVIEIRRDLTKPENTRLTLGNFAKTMADESLQTKATLQTVRDHQGVWDAGGTPFAGPVPTSWLEGTINTLQNEVRAGRGTVTLTEHNGIIITDHPTSPTKALRLLGGIFAIANSIDPASGMWNWRTFGSGDGFTADAINAGRIRTDLVQIFGNSNFFWDGDSLRMLNPANEQEQIHLSREGMRFTKDNGQTWQVALDFNGLRMEGKSGDGFTHYGGDGVRVYDGGNVLRAHLGQYEAGRFGLRIAARNQAVAVDEWGLNPEFIKRFPNKILNSGFEHYFVHSGATAQYPGRPLYWAGDGVCTTWANFEGDVSLELMAGQAIEQGMLDAANHAGADPAWWQSLQTRVSFRQKGAAARVWVRRVSDNLPYTLTDNSGAMPRTGAFLDFSSVDNWENGLRTFFFQPTAGDGRVKVCFQNIGTSPLYLDAVQIEPDFTGRWPSFYTPGPRSLPKSEVGIVEWPKWSVTGDSAANSGLSISRAGESGRIHVVTGFEAVISGAAAGADIIVELRRNTTLLWKSVIGSASPRGARTGLTRAEIEALAGEAVSLNATAGGTGCVVTLNLVGYTRLPS
jgi:phage minor structural protein